MAVFIKHFLTTSRIATHSQVSFCRYATKAEKKAGVDRKQPPKLQWSPESLAARGFLRAQKDYQPPDDVIVQIEQVLASALGKFNDATTLDNHKFKILNSCFEKFQHSVPNSILHRIETVADLKCYYNTPIVTATPLDKLKTMDLPPNLHVQHEYKRFHPDNDEKFGGVTAFPRSSTLVTGLKYKDKYRGHKQDCPWHVD